MRPPSLRQIEAFKAVVEQGTVSAAADLLHVTQPALSKMIRHLEADSGLRLFERVKSRLIPTARGMQLYAEVDRIFFGLNQIERAIEAVRREEAETLRVGVLPALSGRIIEQVVAAFMKAHPGTRVSLIVRETQTLASWVASGQADVVLVGEAAESGLPSLPFMRCHAIATLPPAHPLSGEACLGPGLLAGLPFIHLSEDSRLRRHIIAAFEAEKAPLHSMLEVNTLPTICEMVSGGLGISVMHPLAAFGWRLVRRRFYPGLDTGYLLQRSPMLRNQRLANSFVEVLHDVAVRLMQETEDQLAGEETGSRGP